MYIWVFFTFYNWALILKIPSLRIKTSLRLLDSSQDYTDSTGIDLHEFLVNTLKGNPR